MKNTVYFILVIFIFSVFSESIKIANITALTGEAAKDHESSVNAIRLAAELINESGGVLGKKVELILIDNKSSSLGSKMAALRAIEQNVVGVIGCTYSSFSLAAGPVLQKAGVPMIADVSTNLKVSQIGDYIFRVCFIDSYQGKLLAKFSYKDLNASSAVIMIDSDSEYSKDLSSYFKIDFTRYGGQVLGEKYFRANDKNFTNQLLEINKSNPDLIFIPSYSKEAGLILNQAEKLGLKSVFLGGDGWNEIILKYSGILKNSAYFISHWTKENKSAANQDFLKSYYKKYGENSLIDGGSILTRDAFVLLTDAIARAGSLDRKKIRNELAETNKFPGLAGFITFDEKGDPLKTAVVNKIENDKVIFYKIIE